MPGMRPTSNASLRAPPESRRTKGINACRLRWYYVPRGTDQMRVSGGLRLQLLEQEVERTSITRATLMSQSGMTRQDRHNQGDNLT